MKAVPEECRSTLTGTLLVVIHNAGQCYSVFYCCHSVLWTTFGSKQKFKDQFCNFYALPFIGVTISGIWKCEVHVACIVEMKKCIQKFNGAT